MNTTEELAYHLRNVLECSQLLRDVQIMDKPKNVILSRKGGLAYAENQAKEALLKYEIQKSRE